MVFSTVVVGLLGSVLVSFVGIRPDLMAVVGVLSWVSGPLFVCALLIWPRVSNRHVRHQYLIIDVGIIAIAVVLLIWYVRVGPAASISGSMSFEDIGVLVTSSLLLAGISLAVLRRPTPEYAAPFMLVVLWTAVIFAGNFGLALFAVPMHSMRYLTAGFAVAALLLPILAAESLRIRYYRSFSAKAVEGGNPIPWIAVVAIGGFVLKIGIERLASGVGVIVIGAVVTMLLLVIRQAMTMRHNAELQAERANLLADAKIAAMVRHTSDVIMVVDDQLIVRYASPSSEALWGRAASALQGQDLTTLVEPSSRREVTRLLSERLARPGQTDLARVRVPGPDGTSRRIEAVAVSLLHEPSVHGIVITMRDQTERIQLEEQLAQAQKMEAVGQLAGGVAHDFNNLLTTILGHTEVGLDLLTDDHPVREDLTQIRRASELAASLTRQLLAFSRKQVVEPRLVDVAVSLDQVVRLLRRLIKEHVEIALEVPSDLGEVRVDPSQLEQVVLNLAVNARDAMPDGGLLTIRARLTTVPGPLADAVIPPPQGRCIVVEVVDTGMGMDLTTQARIFEPFFTTKPIGRGTGLGLASVYGIVKQSGAGLVVRSAPGKGSTFSVYFAWVAPEPEQAATVAVDPEREVAALPRFAATILLVEDEAALREIAHKVLAREGYRVLVAADAEEGVILAGTAPFPIDLLLTDVVMPGVSGVELARRLRSKRPSLRVLLMSGYPGDDLAGELRDNQRFLRKPFTPFVMLEHVRAALAGLSDPTSVEPER